MIQTTHSVKNQITRAGTFTLNDIHDITDKKYSKEVFKDVLNTYFREAMEYTLGTGVDLVMGFKLGSIGVRKEPVDYIFRKDGTVYTNCPIDMKATHEYRKENKDSVPLRHKGIEWVIKPVWTKGVFKNKTSYYFKKSPAYSKYLYEETLKNNTSNINELYYDREFNRKIRQG